MCISLVTYITPVTLASDRLNGILIDAPSGGLLCKAESQVE